ncbi:MAG: hypothetical protein HY929_07235 [Euryarchaeota archaeon]|nr:hypothetical protein [Euryarchaeota archaeon]
MGEILGYGEDAFTLWAIKKLISEILNKLKDRSSPSDCLIFFRPSFGRSGGKESEQFGEFDSILASPENIYLIESKWDNFSENKEDEIELEHEQVLRHELFTWYHKNWMSQGYRDWKEFRTVLQNDFERNFLDRKKAIAPVGSLLAENLEFVLRKLKEHFKEFSCVYKEPKNVLFYFYNKNRSKEIWKVRSKDVDVKDVNFEVINIDYSQYVLGNFIHLD